MSLSHLRAPFAVDLQAIVQTPTKKESQYFSLFSTFLCFKMTYLLECTFFKTHETIFITRDEISNPRNIIKRDRVKTWEAVKLAIGQLCSRKLIHPNWVLDLRLVSPTKSMQIKMKYDQCTMRSTLKRIFFYEYAWLLIKIIQEKKHRTILYRCS